MEATREERGTPLVSAETAVAIGLLAATTNLAVNGAREALGWNPWKAGLIVSVAATVAWAALRLGRPALKEVVSAALNGVVVFTAALGLNVVARDVLGMRPPPAQAAQTPQPASPETDIRRYLNNWQQTTVYRMRMLENTVAMTRRNDPDADRRKREIEQARREIAAADLLRNRLESESTRSPGGPGRAFGPLTGGAPPRRGFFQDWF